MIPAGDRPHLAEGHGVCQESAHEAASGAGPVAPCEDSTAPVLPAGRHAVPHPAPGTGRAGRLQCAPALPPR